VASTWVACSLVLTVSMCMHVMSSCGITPAHSEYAGPVFKMYSHQCALERGWKASK
jgi:hypothetical protein